MALIVDIILCNAGTMDNYAYLLTDEKTGISAIVDAPEKKAIVDFCEKKGVAPKYILNTHHHYDHTDSNLELKKIFKAKVVGGVYDKHRIPGIDETVSNGSIFQLGDSKARIIHAPGHTKGGILWCFEEDKIIFTGDVLFNLSIGGLFEGSPVEMFETLDKIKKLSDDFVFYPGHEYTAHGAWGASQVCGKTEAFQEYIKIAEERINQGLPVSPTSLGLEKKCNPYLIAKTFEEFLGLF